MLNLKQFMPQSQINALKAMIRCNESTCFAIELTENIKKQIAQTPKLYETEEQENPLAMLHYFGGSYDAYITERGENGDAFGWASFGYGFEAGYINIEEFIQNGIELDLYHEPAPVKDFIK